MSDFPELNQLRLDIPEATRMRHLAAIEAALRRRPRRRIAVAAFVAAVLVPSTAFAAEAALPGDLLYPVKRALEPVIGLVDADIAATHRIDELERLMARGAVAGGDVDRLISEAEVEVQRHPHLESRLEAVVSDLGSMGDVPTSPEPSTMTIAPTESTRQTEQDRPTDRTTSTMGPTDRATSTTVATATESTGDGSDRGSGGGNSGGLGGSDTTRPSDRGERP
ncbi:MAG: hypothetical protein OEX04_14405 [Acidimicrobiia bacterium]|nr:hypothetical protein [Acidimicrobiia bacterium]